MRRVVPVCALFASAVLGIVAPSAGLAQELEPVSALLERARAEDARTEYHVALALYEAHAQRCLASPTAVLESEGPCAEAGPALLRAFELARGLADFGAAERVARLYTEHMLYAQPREALRVGYELAMLHLDAGRLDEASAAVERWLALFADPPSEQATIADALRGRIAVLRGRTHQAAIFFRRAERRYAAEPPEAESPIPPELVREAVAEARLARAEPLVERFLATDAPRNGAGGDREAWWRRVITPWRVRVQRRLLLARMELERVYELGSPRHSVIAAARIGEMYGHLAELHASIPSPGDEWLQMLLREGQQRPGYDEALTHFQTCVSWAHHHGVAPRWARRCEERLHALDPQRYPLTAELAGSPGYMPVTYAVPGAALTSPP